MSSLHSGRRHHARDVETSAAFTPPVTDGSAPLAPVFHLRADMFQSVHLASYAAVRNILPSDDLHPIRWLDGRALVAVWAFRYEHAAMVDIDGTTDLLSPYGEASVSALVSRGRPRVRGLGMLQAALGSGGGFILDLPVTTAQARDLGRDVYGMTKFVAGMDFTEGQGHRRLVLSECEARIFTLDVHTRGPVLADRTPITSYSVRHGELIETVVGFHGHRQSGLGTRSGRLVLGDHPVADRLRALDVAPQPLIVGSYLDARFVLPPGTPVGPARDYVGYLGGDRERGRFCLSYPGAGPIDLYAEPVGLRRAVDSSATDVEEAASS